MFFEIQILRLNIENSFVQHFLHHQLKFFECDLAVVISIAFAHEFFPHIIVVLLSILSLRLVSEERVITKKSHREAITTKQRLYFFNGDTSILVYIKEIERSLKFFVRKYFTKLNVSCEKLCIVNCTVAIDVNSC